MLRFIHRRHLHFLLHPCFLLLLHCSRSHASTPPHPIMYSILTTTQPPVGMQGMELSAAAKFPCGHDRAVLSVSWGKCGLIAAAGADNSVRVYGAAGDAAAGWHEVGTVAAAHYDDVNCVAWHPTQHDLLASCSDDGSVKVWSVRARVADAHAEAHGGGRDTP